MSSSEQVLNVINRNIFIFCSEGNVFLRSGDVDLAIECYDKALELGDREQEGVLLVMRGSALLQRAYACRFSLKMTFCFLFLTLVRTIFSCQSELSIMSILSINHVSIHYQTYHVMSCQQNEEQRCEHTG